MTLRWPLLLLILMIGVQPATARVLIVNESAGRYALNGFLSYQADPGQSWELTDVVAPPVRDGFALAGEDTLAFGYTDAVYWLKLDLLSMDDRPASWFLVLSGLARAIDRVDVYVPDVDGSWRHMQSGDAVAFDQRALQHHALLFPVTLLPRQSATLYMRLQTNGALQVPASLWTAAHYAEMEHHSYLLEGLFYGALLIMIFYNGFVYLSVRDPSYIDYVGYLISVLLFAVALKGIGFEYLWPDWPVWNNKSNLVFAACCVFFILLFARSFFRTEQRAQRLDRALRVLLLLSLASLPASWFLSHRIAAGMLSGLFLVAIVLVITLALVRWRQGFRAARFYLLAWLGVLFSMVAWILNSAGVINSSWVGAHSFQLGSVVQVCLFSFALADRIRLLREERESAIRLQLSHFKKLESTMRTFERFVPKQFLRRIAAQGVERIELGKAHSTRLTILFMDIRGFTALSETMTPQQVLNFLNAYYSRMEAVLHRHGGFIDKFQGDGVMALFEDEGGLSGAERAVAAAVGIRHAMQAYNTQRASVGYQPIQMGVGVNTGEVIIGTVGSSDRMDSTVLGDAVNLAARLQELTKTMGHAVLVSEYTYQALPDVSCYAWTDVGEVAIRGRQHGVHLYALVVPGEHPGHIRLSTVD